MHFSNLGVRWIRSQIHETQNSSALKIFWDYFNRTWVKRFPPELWNIARFLGDSSAESVSRISHCSRTNNALERYNQTLGNLFPHRPTVPNFVEEISLQAKGYLDVIGLINSRLREKPDHQLLPRSVPAEYTQYAIDHRDELGEIQPVAAEMLTLEQYCLMRSGNFARDGAGEAIIFDNVDNTKNLTVDDPSLNNEYQDYLNEFALIDETPIPKKKRVRGRKAALPILAKKRGKISKK